MGIKNTNYVIDEFALRRLLGFLAFLLPVVVAIGVPVLGGETGLKNSISSYYYTIMRSYFVGTLCAVGVVLFCYKGPERQDDLAGDIAALLALMVAFFPTTPTDLTGCADKLCKEEFIGIIHLTSAALLFIVLSYFSLKLFTKSDKTKKELQKPENKAKRTRNLIYKVCGWVMIGCLLVLIPLFAIEGLEEFREDFKVVFILEFVMLWAFGISWLTKGEIIFSDK